MQIWPGVITITKETHFRNDQNSDESTYYRIDGTTAHERTQDSYLIQQQKGNPRTLKVVEKIKVQNVCKADKAAHEVVSEYHFEDKWYIVKSGEDKKSSYKI